MCACSHYVMGFKVDHIILFIIIAMQQEHRRLQAWAYQGNALVVGEPYASNLGFSIMETVQ